jgi:crotonobetainyl-CoA:carnitine CoA-transferase CaiB-like acyl-CoA transferase
MPLVQEWLLEHTRAELFQMLQVDEHLPSMPVMTVADVVDHPHVAARGTMMDIEHPVIGTFKAPMAATRFSEPVWNIVSAAPLLGEHNAVVLGGLLGYSKEQVDALAQAGAL